MGYSYFFFIQNIFGFDRIKGEVRNKGLERWITQPYVGGRYCHLVELLGVTIVSDINRHENTLSFSISKRYPLQ